MTSKSGNSRQTSNALSFLTVGALLTAGASFWLTKVNEIAPDPYLDEEFHVRQAQVYCSGDFQIWDPKITTPPGLYLVSWLIFKVTGRCSIFDLRALDVVTILLGFLLANNIVGHKLRLDHGFSGGILRSLTAANLWFFPPLFFFSGLYYTDVQSSFWVMMAYQNYVLFEASDFRSQSRMFQQIVLGIIALFFRQTNIFWVAVFPVGLAVVSLAKKQATRVDGAFGSPRPKDSLTILRESWKNMRFYDIPVYEAGIGDYCLCMLSLLLVTLANYKKVLAATLPYLLLIHAFLAFVVWNGGVVLGDKSNHVATIHLPQMLYLWPYMLFFSWPLILSQLITCNIRLSMDNFTSKIFIFGSLTNLAMVIVHYNTIVHPFTLADNRHYTFYIFRILLKREEIRYVVTPVYVLSGWMVLQALGAKPSYTGSINGQGKVTTRKTGHGCNTSFVLIWLVTTTLSLVTAPLVEPRYCILPWMMWRLHIPLIDDESESKNGSDRKKRLLGLVLEMLWFATIALGTGYMFLYRGFAWPQEPGKVQRFMW